MVIKTIEQNESPKTDLHKNGQLMFRILRKAKLNCKSNSVEEGQPFQKHGNLTSTCKKINPT